MRPTASIRTFLTCLVLPLLLSLPCLAQGYPGGQNYPGGTQFTNGQNGTPNLPSSNSCTIDQTHFAGQTAGTATSTYDLAYVLTARKPSFLGQLYVAWQLLKTRDTFDNRQRVLDLINGEYLATLQDLSLQNLKTSSLYLGSEVRTGSGRPIYVLPALSYSNDKYGVELGSESFHEFGTGSSPGRDGVGLSLKVELTDLSRGLARSLVAVKAAQKGLSLLSEIEKLHELVKGGQTSESFDPSTRQFTGLNVLIEVLEPFSPSTPIPRAVLMPLTPTRLKKDSEELDVMALDLLTDYVRYTRRPTVSFIVGDRFVNDGGSLPQAGLTASQLFPLSYGGPGVTLLTVAQGFSDRTRGDLRRDAGRFGAALIFRDRTPALLDEKNNKVPLYKLGTQKLHLGPTWNVKEGLEYTSPILGLKETYAGFVTYRDPGSYGEITLTAGKDGLRKDYLDISIGRSFVF